MARVHSTDFWLDRPTLVTGATGLVGGWLVKRLLGAGADVTCLVRDWVPQSELTRTNLVDRVKRVHGDVCDGPLLERVLGENEIVTVMHLAAQTTVPVANRNPRSTFESNVGGTWTLLEACRRSPLVGQVIVASSDKAYGSHDTLPYREDTPLAALHPYDASKACSDIIAQSYAATFEVPVAITRCGNIYGGGDLNWNRIVPGTIRALVRERRPIVRSDGTPVRDYFYVEDSAAAYMLLAERLASDSSLIGQAFNFSNEEPIGVLNLLERITARFGSTLTPDIRNESSNEILEQYLSASRARAMLGWEPLFSLDEGIDRTIGWYRDFLATS